MKNGYFHIEIMITAAHMLGGMLPSEKFFKKCPIWWTLEYILYKGITLKQILMQNLDFAFALKFVLK